MTESRRPRGRIVTFYSYKGGTGRTMALANVAWVLASAGQRVLLIDWDLEAPGLHHYFRPLLDDPDLTDARGIVDWVADVSAAARESALAANGPIAPLEENARVARSADSLTGAHHENTDRDVPGPSEGTAGSWAIGHTDSVMSVVFSPDGRLIATAAADGTTRIWDTSSGRELRELSGHTGRVWSVVFSPDGQLIVTASADRTARIWDTSTGQELRQLSGHTGPVLSVAFSPNGQLVTTASADGTARIWQTSTGRELRPLHGHTSGVRSAVFSPDARLIATAAADGTTRIWETSTGRELRQLSGHTAWVLSVAFSPDGQLIATASTDGTTRIWETPTGRELGQLSGHTGRVWSVVFSPDGQLIATAAGDGTTRIWEASTARELRQLNGHTGTVFSVAFSPDGQLIATASDDRTGRVWEASTGRELRQLGDHTGSGSTKTTPPAGTPPARDDSTNRAPASTAEPNSSRWWEPYTTLASYSEAVNYDFPDGGLIELVPAGRQDASYGRRVNDTDWSAFYGELGGGTVIEQLRAGLVEDYDFVLIDSRTGIADTAGICTVHLPDELVVCFTLNNQSITGAAAVAASAESQRRSPSGVPTLRVWPLPTRVDLAEKDRLDVARAAGRREFDRFLGHLRRKDRRRYWGAVEVMHQSYYAYEEILAVIADMPGQSASVRRAIEELTRYLIGRHDLEPVDLPEEERHRLVERFLRQDPNRGRSSAKFYLSYPSKRRTLATELVSGMRERGLEVWWDGDLLLGDDVATVAQRVIDACTAVVMITDSDSLSEWQRVELARAVDADKRLVPLFMTSFSGAPPELAGRQGLVLADESQPEVEAVVRQLVNFSEQLGAQTTSFDPEDPQKGRWGGESEAGGRRLSAHVRELDDQWYETTITVERTGSERLVGDVVFYLPPPHGSPQTASVTGDRASITVQSWGAFTVGATTDGGRVHLELDLSTLTDAPTEFVEH